MRPVMAAKPRAPRSPLVRVRTVSARRSISGRGVELAAMATPKAARTTGAAANSRRVLFNVAVQSILAKYSAPKPGHLPTIVQSTRQAGRFSGGKARFGQASTPLQGERPRPTRRFSPDAPIALSPAGNRRACGNSSLSNTLADVAYARAGVYGRVGAVRSGVQHWRRRNPAGAGEVASLVGFRPCRRRLRDRHTDGAHGARGLLSRPRRLHDPVAGRDCRIARGRSAGRADSHPDLPHGRTGAVEPEHRRVRPARPRDPGPHGQLHGRGAVRDRRRLRAS